MEKTIENENTITLNGNFITNDQLDEEMDALKNGEKIVEVSPGKFETLTRMQG